jgi:RNA polymerase sigma factor (sigma-70 family)
LVDLFGGADEFVERLAGGREFDRTHEADDRGAVGGPDPTQSPSFRSNIELEVYSGNVEAVRKAVRSIGTPFADADLDDIVQDVFIKVLGALRTKRISPDDNIRAYAAALARNVTYDFIRRRLRVRRWNEHIDDLMVVLDEDQTQNDERCLSCVETCVSQLPVETRRLYVARFTLGMSQTQAGQYLGISRQSVRTREAHLRREVSRVLSDFLPR